MNEQLDLLRVKAPPAPRTEQVEKLVAVLSEEKDWLSAKEIAMKLSLGSLSEAAIERHVRKVAAASAPRVLSYPGSPGYKLWELCSIEEINHCIEAFECQGRDMFKRANVYRMAYHRRFRGALTPEGKQSSLL
jgi:biotin operon repressor